MWPITLRSSRRLKRPWSDAHASRIYLVRTSNSWSNFSKTVTTTAASLVSWMSFWRSGTVHWALRRLRPNRRARREYDSRPTQERGRNHFPISTIVGQVFNLPGPRRVLNADAHHQAFKNDSGGITSKLVSTHSPSTPCTSAIQRSLSTESHVPTPQPTSTADCTLGSWSNGKLIQRDRQNGAGRVDRALIRTILSVVSDTIVRPTTLGRKTCTAP